MTVPVAHAALRLLLDGERLARRRLANIVAASANSELHGEKTSERCAAGKWRFRGVLIHRPKIESARGFFGTPRGLGFATATTSAAFFPHLEQRIRSASCFSVIFQPTRRATCPGQDLLWSGLIPCCTVMAL